MHRLTTLAASVLALAGVAAAPASAEPLKVGYWSSGVSLGFGTFLQTKKFLEDQGFEVEYVTFPDVNAPTKALVVGGIDFAIGASAGSSLSATADGLPVSIILATQVADLYFAVAPDSEITSLSELAGKRVGGSPAGSATASITAAILDQNYDIAPDDYEAVPGNDSLLAQLLVQGEIDAAALRSVSLALVADANLKTIGSFREEWGKITGEDAAPVLGIGLIRDEWLEEHGEDAAARIVTAMRSAYEYGSAHKDEVATALMEAANISQETADAYAALWDDIYSVTMTPATVESLRTEFEVFKSVGTVSGEFGADKVLTGPFEASKAAD
ncbi:nitrate ABC transporter substrate-binding protein [Acuticoccus sediminis]|uniref:Nitrate ABC transporter substrate-binding protein n=1 Tax=Acuticoccus sediminis TaxID=2184697 RepID=A0A8B2NP56_9HYPH|nr:MqnA/MqnD/SBP family protein [Acuticoccus sediminis]RAH97432.1 nitrate ABC transporter substrate-binding protein [Acuticoccus sediminis]